MRGCRGEGVKGCRDAGCRDAAMQGCRAAKVEREVSKMNRMADEVGDASKRYNDISLQGSHGLES